MVHGISRFHQQTHSTSAHIETGQQVRNLIVEAARMVFKIPMEAAVGKENGVAFQAQVQWAYSHGPARRV